MTAAGAIEVEAPRVRDRRAGERFSSALLPPYLRRSAKVGAVLPLLYLHGLSSGDFEPALDIFTVSRRLGHGKAGFTMYVCGHLLEGQQRAAAKARDHLLAHEPKMNPNEKAAEQFSGPFESRTGDPDRDRVDQTTAVYAPIREQVDAGVAFPVAA